MPATLSGIVFNDLNHNGQYVAGEPGIPGAYITLSGTSGCESTQTAADGSFSFSVTTAGAYTLYEPVADPGTTCPPTAFVQPEGFTFSNGPRKRSVTVTAAQITNSTFISGHDFSHDTVASPLSCLPRMIQLVGRPTQWYTIDLVTGLSAMQGALSPAHDVNAVGYHPLDDYLYAYDQTASQLVRIDASGLLMELAPNPPGLPASGFNTGAFDLSGFLYLFVNNDTRFYTVDLRPDSATFLKLVDPMNGYQEQPGSYGTALSKAINVSDWAYSPVDGFLYGVERVGGAAQRIAPTTGQVTTLVTAGPDPGGSFGAVAIDATGHLYAINNADGGVSRYIIAGDTATGVALSTAFTNSFNDGAICPTASILTDFGDAPDTAAGNGPDHYSTTLAKNGPRHGIVNELLLGTQITSETDAHDNADATGDDIAQGIQDDSLTVPLAPLSVNATAYTLDATVTNHTGQDASLYAWVDFNQDGIFSENEAAAVQPVPSVPGAQEIPLAFTVPAGVTLAQGHTFVRLRLTTDTLTNKNTDLTAVDTRSLGPASDGEVEDYYLTIGDPADVSIIKIGLPNTVVPGNALTYTLSVTNFGPSEAVNVVVTDALPAGLTAPEYSQDGGVTYQPWTGSLALGNVDAGASLFILIRATVGANAIGSLRNTAVVSADTPDPDPINNSSTEITQVEAVTPPEPPPCPPPCHCHCVPCGCASIHSFWEGRCFPQ